MAHYPLPMFANKTLNHPPFTPEFTSVFKGYQNIGTSAIGSKNLRVVSHISVMRLPEPPHNNTACNSVILKHCGASTTMVRSSRRIAIRNRFNKNEMARSRKTTYKLDLWSCFTGMHDDNICGKQKHNSMYCIAIRQLHTLKYNAKENEHLFQNHFLKRLWLPLLTTSDII